MAAGNTEELGQNREELMLLRLNYAKLLTKAGLLTKAREQIDDKVLSEAELPELIKAKALYISGKLGFFENSYARSIRNYESCIDLLKSREDQMRAQDK